MLSKISSLFGKRKDLDVEVKYDDAFFREGWFESWDKLSQVLQELIEVEPRWKNVLDFGCGPGVMIDRMNDAGFNYIGCDYSKDAHELYLKRFGRYPDKYHSNLDVAAKQNYDVLLSFDVFEHMTDQQIVDILKICKNIPMLFLNISRAKNIPGHINLKKDKKWIDFFGKQGYQFDSELTHKIRQVYLRLRDGGPDMWHKNIFIFVKK